MKMAEDHRKLVATLCHDVSMPAGLIAECCDSLLEGAEGPLTEERRGDIDYIHKCSLRLLAVVDEVVQMSEKVRPPTDQEEFATFLRCFLQDLRSPLNGILGCSQLNLEEATGTMNKRQTATIGRVHRLAQTLLLTLAHRQTEAEKYLK